MTVDRLAVLEARVAQLEAVLGGETVSLSEERLLSTMMRHAAALTGLVPAEIRVSRRREHCHARFAVMFVARETLGYSYPRIARAINARDHTTVINGIRRAQQLRDADPIYRNLIERLLATFRRVLADPDILEATTA